VVLPDCLQFPTDGQASVLESGLHAGVELPSSCRNGTCRACMCRLLSGSVRYRVEWPGLSADEKAEGWCLPCVALAQTDLRIEQPFAQSL
jgi:ferredoxin